MKRKIPLLLLLAGVSFCRYLKSDLLIDGQGNYYTLSASDTFHVIPGDKLKFQDITLQDLQNYNGYLPNSGIFSGIVMADIGSELTLQNSRLNLSGLYTMTAGTWVIIGDVTLSGSEFFGFNSTVNTTIAKNSTLFLDRGLTFSFGSTGIIHLTDATSKIQVLDDAVFSSILTLSLTGGSVIRLADVVTTLLGVDTLTVNGQNNEIVVQNILYLYGTLDFVPGTVPELIFTFDDQAANPAIYVRNNITLPDGAKLTFRGNGTVYFENGKSIHMQGTSATKDVTLSFMDSAEVKIESAGGAAISQMTIDGKGKIVVDEGGRILIEDHRALNIGGNGRTSDDINILVDRDGTILVSGDYASLKLWKATLDLDFEERGCLVAQYNGQIQINPFENGATTNGLLTSFKFDQDGYLNLQSTGRMMIGENYSTTPFAWDSRGGDIIGDGLIGLVEQQAFTGRLTEDNRLSRLFLNSRITAEELVRKLVNVKSAELPESAVFVDRNNDNQLRIKNSTIRSGIGNVVIVKLPASDDITGEDNLAVYGNDTILKRGISYNLTGQRS